jgi:pimeloyl-ACP methyl ester carboxylesterase
MVALRHALGAREAVYVGVSAGGLAALIAASRDPEGTRALLLLDPVNAGGQARSAAGKVRAPVAALVAKPQVCNAWGNIEPALRSLGDAATVRVPHASHCDFEWPGDRFCRVACVATNGSAERSEAQARIRRLGVEFVAAAAHGDQAALARWRRAAGSLLPDSVTFLAATRP